MPVAPPPRQRWKKRTCITCERGGCWCARRRVRVEPRARAEVAASAGVCGHLSQELSRSRYPLSAEQTVRGRQRQLSTSY
ncbi:hypothetical protein O3P69_017152 [Scylla paramamosain]|uniref:Uncharacterized protein n=1 Tax=Scylla paramamosain TaxID=85552 RepID=A0AAW0TU68_SCYPA